LETWKVTEPLWVDKRHEVLCRAEGLNLGCLREDAHHGRGIGFALGVCLWCTILRHVEHAELVQALGAEVVADLDSQ
jgi:hypothetical protein